MATAKDFPEYSTLLRLLGEKDVKVAKLEDEANDLRRQLGVLPQNPVSTGHPTSNAATSVPCDQEEDSPADVSSHLLRSVNASYDALSTKYNDLAKLYRDLQAKHDKCKPKMDLAMEYYKKAKVNARQWKTYLERQDARKIRSTPVSTGSQIGNLLVEEDHEVTPRPGPAVMTEPQQALVPPATVPRIPMAPLLLATGTKDDRGPITPDSPVRRAPSSQTTQEGSDPADQVASSPPDDGSDPVVVSTRLLKRKRSNSTRVMRPPTRIKQEPHSPTRPIELRSEDYSSPVQQPRHKFPTETSDLDVLPTDLRVPRRHRTQEPSNRAVSEELARPPPLTTRVSSLSDNGLSDLAELPTHIKLEPVTSRLPDLAPNHKPSAGDGPANPLGPLSVNFTSKSRSRDVPSAKRPPDKPRVERAKVAALSEDGEDMSSQAQTKSWSRTIPKAPVTRRLDTMLEVPFPEKLPLAKDQAPVSAIAQLRRLRSPMAEVDQVVEKPSASVMRQPLRASFQDIGAPTPAINKPDRAKRLSPRKRDTPTATRPFGIEGSPPPMGPEDEPLRLRPLSSLHLNDFRVNPKFMGTDFAYSETLRGRDQRRCMAGCTKPECCGGAFRKAVEMVGNLGSTKTDAEVLEAYLGSNWQQLMGAYAPDKRKDLLMQAHVSFMANQFGKHRQNFERRSTPPGFWRTDMPNTQEAEEDRARAVTLEKQKVEERWREAMREGGRWRFRDE